MLFQLERSNPGGPWLVPHDREVSMKAPRLSIEIAVSKECSAVTKSKKKLRKQTRKLEEEKKKAKDEAVVETPMEKILTLKSTVPASKIALSDGPQESATKHVDANDDSDVNNEVEAQGQVLTLKAERKQKGARRI